MYRNIDAAFWTDKKVRRLKPSERLLFLYLITNPHTHVSGLYYLPWLIAQHESGLTKEDLDLAATTLSDMKLCRFDHENELVWVVQMFKFQGRGQKNTLSAAHHLSEDCHNSFLIKEFIDVYSHVAKHIKAGVLNRVSGFGPPETNTETKPETKTDILPDAAAPASDPPVKAVDPPSDPGPKTTPPGKPGKVKIEKPEAAPDDRRIPFKDFMFDSLRAVKIEPLTGPKTWRAYEDFLTASRGKPAFTLEKLKEYFARLVNSPSPYIRSLGDPIFYFCKHVSGFMRDDKHARPESPAVERAKRNADAKARVLAGLNGTNGVDTAEGSTAGSPGALPQGPRRS